MTHALSNKALATLALLRETGETTCKDLAAAMRERTPCAPCNGTGSGDDSRWGCRHCYGRGQVSFGYSDAYVCLKQLLARGLVSRRWLENEWGDPTNTQVWRVVGSESPNGDALEALFLAPSANRSEP